MNRFIVRRLVWLEAEASGLESKDRHDEAIPVRQEHCRQIEEHLGPRHPWLAQALLRLATVHRSAGQLDQAEHIYLKAIRCLERTEEDFKSAPSPISADGTTFGPSQAELARALNTLGVFYCERGEPLRALRPLRRALELSKKTTSGNDPRLGTLYNNLGSALHSLGRLESASHHYRRALEIFERSGGPLELAHCLIDLAELSIEIDDASTATEATERTLSLLEHHLRRDSVEWAHTLVRVSGLYLRQSRRNRAIDALEEAAQLFGTAPDHAPQLADCLDLLGQLNRSQK